MPLTWATLAERVGSAGIEPAVRKRDELTTRQSTMERAAVKKGLKPDPSRAANRRLSKVGDGTRRTRVNRRSERSAWFWSGLKEMAEAAGVEPAPAGLESAMLP